MKKLSIPFNIEELKQLKAGDMVLLSGTIYTARDAAHKRLVDLIKEGKELPIDLKESVIYYVGPTPTKPGDVIGSCGPTSSYRMDSFIEPLLKQGFRASIGKGDRAEYINSLCKEYTSVYFCAIGGTAAKLAKCVTKSVTVCYEDLGAEAIRKLEIKDFPVIVGIDTRGDSVL